MKTLLKNRRSYKHRIGSLDDVQHTMKKEESHAEKGIDRDGNNDDNGDNDENDDDSWDNMYMEHKEKHVDTEEEEEEEGNKDGDDEGGNGGDGSGDEDGIGGDGDEDGNGGKERNGSRQMKRKFTVTQDNETAAAARPKRTKRGGSGSHQVASRSTKKPQSKKMSGSKRKD